MYQIMTVKSGMERERVMLFHIMVKDISDTYKISTAAWIKVLKHFYGLTITVLLDFFQVVFLMIRYQLY